MLEAGLWLVFLAIVAWAGVKLISLGRDSEKARAAEKRGKDMAEAAKIRESIARDERDPRDRLRDEWQR